MTQFSRLQLAAALIEYDNDPDDPSKPIRSAQDSAIFTFLRHAKDPRKVMMGYQEPRRNSVDFLGVALPSERMGIEGASAPVQGHDDTGRTSWMGGKAPSVAARKSLDHFRSQSQDLEHLNKTMFQDEDDEDGDDDGMERPELNLASWGVDQFLSKDDEKKKRRHSRASTLNELGGGRPISPGGIPTHPARAVSPAAMSVLVDRAPNRRVDVSKARSVGNWSEAGLIDEIPPERPSATFSRGRAKSIADPLEIANANDLPPAQFRRGHTRQSGSTSGAVPFPSMISPNVDLPNPFELPPPAPERSSRFDPKILAHQRTLSFASLNSRQILDAAELQQERQYDFNDNASVMTGAFQREGPARYSRIDMLRPKVLIMPSPLQDHQQQPTAPTKMIREGFEDTTGARPMPPGAKTNGPRPGSTMFGAGEPQIGFTPNPRSSMTLAQLTFRNTLMVGGERDVAYADIEVNLRRAEEEGVQIDLGIAPEEAPEPPRRAPGKLYGHSLMDELEARKNQLKGKQRVFRGDERPSMMQRAQPQRQSTLINPESLQQPAQARLERLDLTRAPSSGKPLLDFSKDKVPGTSGNGVAARPPGTGVRMPMSHSVFGVDEIWEREMTKVKKIEEQERQEAEARQRTENETAAKKAAKTQGNSNATDLLVPPTASAVPPKEPDSEPLSPAVPRVATEPPLLPNVSLASAVPVPTTPSTTDSEEERPGRRRPQGKNKARKAPAAADNAWDNSSDEERERQKQIRAGKVADDDSDSDVPLAAAAIRARRRQQEESEEDDQPLASVVAKKLAGPPRPTNYSTASGFNLPSFEFDKPTKRDADDDDDDDDKPLGLKRLTAMGGDDDDQPLGMRYSMAPSQMLFQQQAQAQVQMQQQQQMMMQMAAAAQVRQTMFNPMMGMSMGGMGMMNPAMSMNGMGMVGSPMAMGLNPAMAGAMQTPSLQLGSTLAVVDPAKHARLDRWRREITDDD